MYLKDQLMQLPSNEIEFHTSSIYYFCAHKVAFISFIVINSIPFVCWRRGGGRWAIIPDIFIYRVGLLEFLRERK